MPLETLLDMNKILNRARETIRILLGRPRMTPAQLEADALLQYIKNHNTKKILPEDYAILVKASRHGGSESFTEEDQTRLMEALERIGEALMPITIESVVVSQSRNSQKDLVKYLFYSICIFGSFVSLQAFFLVGSSILEKSQKPHDSLKQSLREYAMLESEKPEFKPSGETSEQEKIWKAKEYSLGVSIQEHLDDLSLYRWSIGWWNFVWELPLRFLKQIVDKHAPGQLGNVENVFWGKGTSKKPNEANIALFEFDRARFKAEIMQMFLEKFILPFLAGLLGACFFVVKTMIHEISSFTLKRNHMSMPRLVLGGLSGILLVLLFRPGETSTLASMSILALAFIGGYSVDAIFSICDRLAALIPKENQQQAPVPSTDSQALQTAP